MCLIATNFHGSMQCSCFDDIDVMINFIVVCNGYLCVTLQAFNYLWPPAPWMRSDDFLTTAESICVCEVCVQGKGCFPVAAHWLDKSVCYEVLTFVLDVMQCSVTFHSQTLLLSPGFLTASHTSHKHALEDHHFQLQLHPAGQ